MGNYYSDYDGLDDGSEGRTAGDGIGDTNIPYTTDGSGDNYPIMQTSDNYSLMAWWLSAFPMYKADMTKGPGMVTIPSSGSKVWVADEAAECDVTFPNDTWTGQVVFTSSVTGSNFTLDVGHANSDGTGFTSGGPQATLEGTGTTFTYTTSSQSFTVPTGKYLALQITNAWLARNVQVGGAWSYLSAPDTACPEYPTPELPTIILSSLGLAALAGFAWRRRRNKQAVTSN